MTTCVGILMNAVVENRKSSLEAMINLRGELESYFWAAQLSKGELGGIGGLGNCAKLDWLSHSL